MDAECEDRMAQEERVELKAAADYIRSRQAAGANLVVTVRALAEVMGQTIAQVPAPFAMARRVELVAEQVRRGVDRYARDAARRRAH